MLIIETIDLRKLTTLPIKEFTNGFEVRWDNTLLVTRYQQKQTLVLTRYGQLIVLNQSLKKVLDRFSEVAGIHYYEMRCLYQMITERTLGYVAGNYALVPTCGRTNPAVVYFMNHYLDNYCFDEEADAVLATFKGKKREMIRVIIDTNMKTFRRMRRAAHDVGTIHLSSLENLCRHYGARKGDVTGMVRKSAGYNWRQHRQHHESMIFQIMAQTVAAAAMQAYGENFNANFYHVLFDRYHQSNCRNSWNIVHNFNICLVIRYNNDG